MPTPPRIPRLLAALSLALAACRAAPPLKLPKLDADPAVSLRLVVIGDAGYPGPGHDAAFQTLVRAGELIRDDRAGPLLALVPGDLFYEAGLPADCARARTRVDAEYLRLAPDFTFIAVAGNHDHGSPGAEEVPAIARRAAFFDCAHQAEAAAATGWNPATCACDRRWEYPTGLGDVGTRSLVEPAPGRSGFTLVTYDSQAALARPDDVAQQLEAALDAVLADRRIVVMGHHPLASNGPHGTDPTPGAQDLKSRPYAAYIARFAPIFEARAARIALLVFGHDHTLELRPGRPPLLISGAGAKATSVAPAVPGGFAAGNTPGFALLDLRLDGGLAVTFVDDRAPSRYELPAPR